MFRLVLFDHIRSADEMPSEEWIGVDRRNAIPDRACFRSRKTLDINKILYSHRIYYKKYLHNS